MLSYVQASHMPWGFVKTQTVIWGSNVEIHGDSYETQTSDNHGKGPTCNIIFNIPQKPKLLVVSYNFKSLPVFPKVVQQITTFLKTYNFH